VYAQERIVPSVFVAHGSPFQRFCTSDPGTLHPLRGKTAINCVLAKEVALSVQHGVHDSLSYQSPFTNFQTGLNMDATDDFIASAIAGGLATSLV